MTAFAQDPERLTIEDANFRAVKGDLLDPAALTAAVPGHEAVLFAVESDRKPTSVRTDGARNTVAAMAKGAVRRLVAMSGLGAGVTRKSMGIYFDFVVANFVLGNLLKDQNGLKAMIRKSDLDWVIVRPGELKDEPPKHKWAVSLDGTGISTTVSREDVAMFMLEWLASDEYLRRPAAIGY